MSFYDKQKVSQNVTEDFSVELTVVNPGAHVLQSSTGVVSRSEAIDVSH